MSGAALRPAFLAVLASGLIFLAAAGAARSTNLHLKYGSYWDCSYITSSSPLRPLCEACEATKMHFFQDGPEAGHCVPRAASDEKPVEPEVVVVTPSGAPGARSRGFYGAIATAKHSMRTVEGGRAGTRHSLAIGVAFDGPRINAATTRGYRTPEAAQRDALRACRSQGVPGCTIVQTVKDDCFYIAFGTNPKTGPGWVLGREPGGAMKRCGGRLGIACRSIGGCTGPCTQPTCCHGSSCTSSTEFPGYIPSRP